MPRETAGIGEFPFVAKNINEHTVAAFGVQPVNRFVKNQVVIHAVKPRFM